ncbi:hypothetical protein Gpo141_00009486 [Globisporangium polare]
MGNEISTIGGGAATVGAAVLAGVTFGQVDDLNRAVVDAAKFTADHAEKTVVRHVGETVAMAVATAGVSVASGVTFGQIDALNDAVVHCAKQTALAGERTGAELMNVADGLTDSIPIVGHVKGGIFYATGDHERGERAMKSSSRTVGVIGGGVGGFFVAGPIGAVAGGVAGGAAMDGVITGAESAIHQEYRPHGQIASWTQVANATTGNERIGGIVSGVMTPVVDGFTGYASARTVNVIRQKVAAINNASALNNSSTTSTTTASSKLSLDSSQTVDNAVIGSAKLKAAAQHGSSASDSVVKPVAGGIGVVTAVNNVDTLFKKFSNGDVKQAVDDALENVARLGRRVQEQAVGDSILFEPRVGGGESTSRNNSSFRPTLQHMWDQVVKQFKDGLREQRSGEPALDGAVDTSRLNTREAANAVRDSLNQSVDNSNNEQEPVEGLVKQALGVLAGFVGGKTAEVLKEVAQSDKTKQALENLWGQVVTRFKDAVERKIAGESASESTAATIPENAAGALVVVPEPQLDVRGAPKGSELFFVLIVIYAALSALLMAGQK